MGEDLERVLSGMPVDAFMDRRTVHKRPSRFEGSQLQGVGQSVGQKPPGNKKAAEISGLFVILGGGTGIRTLDRLLTYAGFQDRCIQPLCHPSGLWVRIITAFPWKSTPLVQT